MSALVVLVVGLVLCLAGSFSLRLLVLAAGFGAAWTLAEVMHADVGTGLLIGLAGAVLAYALTLLASRFLFFVGGLCVGALVGAKLFVLVHGGGADVLLAVVLVPAVALVSALLARRFQQPFLVWGTAIGGAALVMSGVGRLWSDVAGDLWRPESSAGVVLVLAAWVVLSVVGHRVQKSGAARGGGRFTGNG